MGKFFRFKVLLYMVLVLGFSANSVWGDLITVATFADPALDSSTPLFTVVYGTGGSVTGGWSDAQTGLDLEVPIINNTYFDAFFELTDLVYNGNSGGGTTGGGTIKFFADGANPITATPVVTVGFDSAQVDPGSFYGDCLFQFNNVDITVVGYSGVLERRAVFFWIC